MYSGLRLIMVDSASTITPKSPDSLHEPGVSTAAPVLRSAAALRVTPPARCGRRAVRGRGVRRPVRTPRSSQTTRRGVELRPVGDDDEGLGAFPVGQQHVVDPGVDGRDLGGDGGDLGGEVAPDTLTLDMYETPHTKEHADPGEHRGDHVLVHRGSVPRRARQITRNRPDASACRMAVRGRRGPPAHLARLREHEKGRCARPALLQRPILRRRCKDRAGDGGRAGSCSARSTPNCPMAPAFTRPASKDRAQEPRGAPA